MDMEFCWKFAAVVTISIKFAEWDNVSVNSIFLGQTWANVKTKNAPVVIVQFKQIKQKHIKRGSQVFVDFWQHKQKLNLKKVRLVFRL